jgi:tetratricopeptide (TPR) repeat protein
MAVVLNSEESGIGERLISVIQSHRKAFGIGFGALLVSLIGFVAAVSIYNSVRAKAVSKAEEFDQRYETLRLDINNDTKKEEVDLFLDELTAFAEKNSGYASARAYSIMANIYADRKNWTDAESAWTAAAVRVSKTYLEPVSFYNAAVAAEERGNIEKALEFYKQSLSGVAFSAASRAQFAIGRIEESRNNKEAALSAYRELISLWPDDAPWTNLAQSRIVFLSSGM